MGKPAVVNPQGTEIAGNPQILNGRVFRSNLNSAGRSASGSFFKSAIAGAAIGIVGVTSTSTSAKTAPILRRAASNSRRHRMYSAADTPSPDRIRRTVSA